MVDFQTVRNKADYKKIVTQMKDKIVFGEKINILIFTDCFKGCAAGLYKYLKNSIDITVYIAANLERARQIIGESVRIDFLIIIGDLTKKKNYCVKHELEKIKPFTVTIMYASLDGLVESKCIKHKIKYKFNKEMPLDDFLLYLRYCHKIEKLYRGSKVIYDNQKRCRKVGTKYKVIVLSFIVAALTIYFMYLVYFHATK